MKYCKKCLMPDTRTGSIFKDGVCQACRNYEKRKIVNWQERKKKLKELCDKYRRKDGYYDCVIPVSGGKDSHFLVHTMKEMDMHPLLVTVGDPFTKTKAGIHNLRNLTSKYDHIQFNPNPDLFKKMTRFAFEEWLNPLCFLEALISIVPTNLAIKYGIPFIVYGENSAFEYGSTDYEIWSARDEIRDFASRLEKFKGESAFVLGDISQVEPIFLSFFFPWSSITNLKIAKEYGFRDLGDEWKRKGSIENFEQIDSVAYMVHLWLKYPKFGFQRVSDIASRRVREGLLSLKEAKKLIAEHDHKLDPRAMEDFIKFLGYSPNQFWEIVERFWNREIFKKVNGEWQLKSPKDVKELK